MGAIANLHGAAFHKGPACPIFPYMDRKATYIRAWRDKRGYTLDDMVGRLDAMNVATTSASLSRIERGIQPYNQDTLEAIAAALDVTAAQLLEHNPAIAQTHVVDLVQRLNQREAEQAEAVLRAMFPNGERHSA